jgi:rubrerythrin
MVMGVVVGEGSWGSVVTRKWGERYLKYNNINNTMTNIKTCKICNYLWEARGEEEPKQCPRCKRYDYNKKKPIKK